ncbi:polysaccharide pyruvyl transferase family protein [Roseicyclus persicicus]|uniref:Polysaccharide pyruvyl transferase family protein n=1 Tax=Roseicyclus persicicus TaxID=2650661 RepID=A0A7X6GYF2_9RHOB|nr:polysaccharide pyruvyl transferase family protein [Roseibacterium persicicum]NKX43586.1 polysaccharide pyruvyl transferase family protein [Roseibacterium persicicum]
MITLLNAAPDTGNQGVSALCHSVVAGLWQRGARRLAVADHGRGLRRADWGDAQVDLVGLTHHRRVWRGDNLRATHAMLRLGVPGTLPARVVAGSRAVLDISGGDSFTDLYGPRRFRAMVLSKRLALAAGVPLILLPQKLGPFRDPANEAEAVDILRRAAAVWVRDAGSFAFLQAALGDGFDPARHRLAVDVAVALPAQAPEGLDRETMAWLAPDRGFPLAGLNVSGLLCNDAAGARRAFGLADRHDAQIEALATALLDADPGLRLLLVPHVHRPDGDPESDLDAARALKLRLGSRAEGRVRVLDAPLPATELKWVLSRLDWFAGARMHATIGAFSSGTPTLGLGYSDKAEGVFAECGIAADVADLRRLDAAALAARAVASYGARAARAADLSARVAGLRARAAAEMDAIAAQAGL